MQSDDLDSSSNSEPELLPLHFNLDSDFQSQDPPNLSLMNCFDVTSVSGIQLL